MGSTVLYVLEWALALLLLLAVYKLFFSGTTMHRFNRCYLLGATVLSALLPFVHLTMPQAKGISIQSTSFAHMLQEVTIYADAPAEAIRVISEMPKWKPSRQRGQEVSVRFTVPVNFMLN